MQKLKINFFYTKKKIKSNNQVKIPLMPNYKIWKTVRMIIQTRNLPNHSEKYL